MRHFVNLINTCMYLFEKIRRVIFCKMRPNVEFGVLNRDQPCYVDRMAQVMLPVLHFLANKPASHKLAAQCDREEEEEELAKR